MTGILIGTGVLAAIALVFGLLLTLVNKVFEVPTDPRRDEIRALLPGANCGACGYPGCDGLADAIFAGNAPVDACTVGGSIVTNKVAAIVGKAAGAEQVRKVATVVCQGTLSRCGEKFTYHGIQDCVAATLINDGNRTCQYACLGLGTCVQVCRFDAIRIDEHDKIAVVDIVKCTSCGACVKSCPKKVLSMQAVNLPVRVLCRAAEEGYLVSDNCKVGCIGCELCMRICKFDAITMVNHLPVIDLNRCTSCMMCAEVCPTTAMWGDFDHRRIALIDRDLCIGCDICKKTCQFDAISGVRKGIYEVTEACTGCGQCVPKCPKSAISLPIREHLRDANAKAGTDEGESVVLTKEDCKQESKETQA